MKVLEYMANTQVINYSVGATLLLCIVALRCVIIQESADTPSDKICEAVERMTSTDKYVISVC